MYQNIATQSREEVLTAATLSLRHWEELESLDNFSAIKAARIYMDACKLCTEFYDEECAYCPLFAVMGGKCGQGGIEDMWLPVHKIRYQMWGTNVTVEDWQKACKNMVNALKEAIEYARTSEDYAD